MTPTTEKAIQNAAAIPAKLMTAEELSQTPRDEQKRELVKGELRLMPPTRFEHGEITGNLTGPLQVHVKTDKLGIVAAAETGYFIAHDPDTVRAPDVSFVSRERIEQIGKTKKFFPEAPDLAVEVLSPSDTVYEVEEKIEDWLQAGVKLVWIVNPKQRTVKVYRSTMDFQTLRETDSLDGEDVVPGFQIKIADIFS
jgi:Uma2 family endonuclease